MYPAILPSITSPYFFYSFQSKLQTSYTYHKYFNVCHYYIFQYSLWFFLLLQIYTKLHSQILNVPLLFFFLKMHIPVSLKSYQMHLAITPESSLISSHRVFTFTNPQRQQQCHNIWGNSVTQKWNFNGPRINQKQKDKQ